MLELEPLINGREYGWADIICTIGGRTRYGYCCHKVRRGAGERERIWCGSPPCESWVWQSEDYRFYHCACLNRNGTES